MPETVLDKAVVREGDFAGPIAWRGETLGAEDGMLRLDRACLEELDAVVAELRANPLPTLMVTPDLFDLPACRAFMGGQPPKSTRARAIPASPPTAYSRYVSSPSV